MAVSAKRNARIELTADAKGMDTGLNDARRKLRTMEREETNAAKASQRAAQKRNSRIAGAADSFGKGIAASAGFEVESGLTGMVSDIIATDRELTRFQIDAQLTRDQTMAFNDSLLRVSSSTGVARKSLVEAAHAYQILTGDAKGAIESSQLFAEVANASGAGMEEIAAVAASMNKNLGLDPSQFRAGFDVILSMGHKGSVELRDLAGELSSIAPMFSRFGGAETGTTKLTKMVAALQVIRHGFGSASEAATGLQSLMAGLERKHAKLEAAGVQVFTTDPKTKQRIERDFFDIIDDIKKKKIDMVDLLGDLGRVEGVKAAIELVSEKGNAEMHDLYNTALNTNQVAVDNATYMNSTAGRLALLWERIKNMVAEAFSSERLAAFVDGLSWIADKYASIFNLGRSAADFVGGNVPKGGFTTQGDRDLLNTDVGRLSANPDSDEYKHAAQIYSGAAGITPERLASKLEVAKHDMASDAAFAAEVAKIMEAEHGTEKTTTQSINEAMIAHFADASTPQGLAQQQAGDRYLRSTGIETYTKAEAFDRAIDKLGAVLKDSLTNIVVKANADAIASTGSNAPINRGSHSVKW